MGGIHEYRYEQHTTRKETCDVGRMKQVPVRQLLKVVLGVTKIESVWFFEATTDHGGK
jgi:hypothetical protein